MLSFPIIILCSLNDNQMSREIDAPRKCAGCNQHLKHVHKKSFRLCAITVVRLETLSVIKFQTYKGAISASFNSSHAVCSAVLYTVSQKTSHLWLAITLTHMNGLDLFWQKCYR